nr:MAG TPA: hypothetical protein [Caudoviricetes sp.]
MICRRFMILLQAQILLVIIILPKRWQIPRFL